jgi:cytochrome c oxidase subunit 3
MVTASTQGAYPEQIQPADPHREDEHVGIQTPTGERTSPGEGRQREISRRLRRGEQGADQAHRRQAKAHTDQDTSTNRGVGMPRGRRIVIMRPVATAAALPASRLHGHHDRPSMVSVGTIVWLSSELMFFAALFAVLHRPLGERARRCGRGDATAQRAVRLREHHHPGALLGHLPDGRVRRRTWQVGRTGPCGRSQAGACASGSSSRSSWARSSSPASAFEYAELVHEGLTIPSSAYGTLFYPRHRLPRSSM